MVLRSSVLSCSAKMAANRTRTAGTGTAANRTARTGQRNRTAGIEPMESMAPAEPTRTGTGNIVAEGFEPYEVQRFDFEPQSLTMSFEPWARASSH